MASRNADKDTKISPKFMEMTPYQIYLQQVQGVTESVRAKRENYDYLPPQLGGLTGQLEVMRNELVLQLIDFQVGDGTQ